MLNSMSVPDKKLVLLIACITLGQENEVNKGGNLIFSRRI